MAKLFDYNATVVTPITDGVSIAVPQTPANAVLASVIVNVPNIVPRYVEKGQRSAYAATWVPVNIYTAFPEAEPKFITPCKESKPVLKHSRSIP